MKLLIRGGRVVDPGRGLDGVADVLIEHGVVTRVEPEIAPPPHGEVLDAEGLIVSPGLIDIHVHLREPGQTGKETIATGTRAAVAGGFTAVACIANTTPPNDSRLITEAILAAAERSGNARVYPIGAVSKGLTGDEIAPFGELAAAGCAGFSDDGRPVASAELMRRALEYAMQFDRPLIQHAQDLDLSADGVMHEGRWSHGCGLPGIPGLAEEVMIARDVLLVEETGGRYHVAHLSTARALRIVREAKGRGLRVTCEVTPHHLLLADRTVIESGFHTHWKMNPPLRAESDVEALLEGLADGSIDAIASDHAPHAADEKALEFELAPFGIVGLETTLPLCLDRLVRAGRISLPRLVELLSTGPARVLGVPGGSLAPGTVGDVTLIDLEREVEVIPEHFASKSRNTPFAGWKLRGAAVATIVGGRIVYRAD